jgi:hypothetical protein
MIDTESPTMRRRRDWLSARREAVDRILSTCGLADNEATRARIADAVEEAMVGSALAMADTILGAEEQVGSSYDRRRVNIGPAAGAQERRGHRRQP